MENKTAEKKYLRDVLKKKIKSMTDEDINKESLGMTGILTDLPQWRNNRNILLFFSMKGREIDTSLLIKKGRKEGKVLAFPRMDGEIIRFHTVDEENMSKLEHHSYGVVEPSSALPEFIPSEKNRALIVTPGLGFTREGKRLGRGKGYYDRYLEKYGKFLDIVAVSLSCQLMDSLPEEESDYRIPVIVTPSEVIHARKKQSVN